MRKIFFLLLMLSFSIAEECIKCEEVATLTPTKMFVVSDESNYILKIYLYNATNNAPLVNTPIIIHRYNTSDHFFEKTFTDLKGIATYDFSSYKNDCFTYQILFCSCNDTEVRKCCFELNGINVHLPNIPFTISSIPLAKGAYNPYDTEIIYNYHAFPATEFYSYCKPQKDITATPAFCLPLAIIFALLGGSLALTGRNPLRGFDIGGARVGKHIRYDSRGRGAGYTITSVLFTIRSTATAVNEIKEIKARMDTGSSFFDAYGTLAKEKFQDEVKNIVSPISRLGNIGGAISSSFDKKMSLKDTFVDIGKLTAKAGVQILEKSAHVVISPFRREGGVGGGAGGVALNLGSQEKEKEYASPIFTLFSKITFGLVDFKKVDEKFNDFKLSLTTNAEIKIKKAFLLDIKNDLEEYEKKIKQTFDTKEGKVSVELQKKEESLEGKTIKVGDRSITIISINSDGSITYEEEGKIKVSFRGDKDNERLNKTISILSKDLEEKNISTVGYLSITIGDQKYLVTKEGANIVVYGVAGKLSGAEFDKIKNVYEEVVNQRSDFAVGAYNDALGKYNDKLAEYQREAGSFRQIGNVLVKGEIEVGKEKIRSIVSQNIDEKDVRAIDEAAVINVRNLTKDLKDEKLSKALESYNTASERFTEVLSADYTAKKLGISAEQLSKEIQEGGYKNVKEYLIAQKEALAYAEAKHPLTEEQLNMQKNINSLLKEINAAEKQLEKTGNDVVKTLDKNIENIKDLLRNGNAPSFSSAMEEKEQLENLKKYFAFRSEDPYDKVDAIYYGKTVTPVINAEKTDKGISFTSDEGFKITVVPDEEGKRVKSYIVDDGEVEYKIGKDPKDVQISTKINRVDTFIFSKVSADDEKITSYVLTDPTSKKVYRISEEMVGEEKKIVVYTIDEGKERRLSPNDPITQDIFDIYNKLPDNQKIGSNYWSQVKDNDIAKTVREDALAEIPEQYRVEVGNVTSLFKDYERLEPARNAGNKVNLLEKYDNYVNMTNKILDRILIEDKNIDVYQKELENSVILPLIIKNMEKGNEKDYKTLLDTALRTKTTKGMLLPDELEMGEMKNKTELI
ncbi:MAG: hypothetical protein QW153_00955 [Candidatus Bilamarchaeaceae archaeon]